MCNYRPITLIPIISKVFEKVMYDKIYSFFTTEGLFKDEQFGFRKDRSTTLACFHLIKEITKNLDSGMHTLAIFLDMSKAFDFVSHKLLLAKIERYGLRGTALSWIASYLSDRQQCVEITKMTGSEKKTFSSSFSFNRCGVPQGSVLGPLLFLLYINDLPNALNQKCILFADDTTLITKSKSKEELKEISNIALEKIINWLENNNLNLNIKKTKLMTFQTQQSVQSNIDIHYKNNEIDNVMTTKFLGIIIDKFCSWKPHIDSVINKLDRFVYALNRIRQLVSKPAATAAYHGYVASVLRYGLILWGNSVDIPRAFKVQKKCIRSICGADYMESCKPLFGSLNILPLPCLYIFETGVFVHKHLSLFKEKNSLANYRGRKENKLCIPSQRLALYSRNINCMAVRIYNKVPDLFKLLPYNKFKKTFHKFLIDKMYYTINEFLDDKI